MKNSDHEDLLIKKITTTLDADMDTLDDEICTRLTRARQKALAQRPEPKSVRWMRLSFAGLAAAGLMWTAAMFFHRGFFFILPDLHRNSYYIISLIF